MGHQSTIKNAENLCFCELFLYLCNKPNNKNMTEKGRAWIIIAFWIVCSLMFIVMCVYMLVTGCTLAAFLMYIVPVIAIITAGSIFLYKTLKREIFNDKK